jgi:peptidoglycan/LPS O-acetylase OafA/YrhL
MVKKFLYLNGLAILAVIIFHASGWGFTAMFSWSHRYLPPQIDPFTQINSLPYYVLRLIEQFVVFSIPAFLFVSGFFVAFTTPSTNKSISWKTVFNRIKFLFIPFVVWTTFILFTNILQGKNPGVIDLIRFYLTGSITPAYYFVILLIQYYLLSPILVPLAKNHWKKLFITTALLQIFIHVFQYFLIFLPESPAVSVILQFLPKWAFPVRLFWFSLGLIIAFHKEIWKKFLEKKEKVWIGITLLLYIAGFFEWELILNKTGLDWIDTRETLVDGFYAFSFLMAFLSTSVKFPIRKNIEKMGSQSFGIYLVHIPVMDFFSRAVYHFIPWLLGQTLLYIILVAILGLALPLLLMWFFRNTFFKKVYGFVFG